MYNSRLARVTSALYDIPITSVAEKIIKLPALPLGKIEESFPKQDKDIVTCENTAKNGFSLSRAIQILRETKILPQFKNISSAEEIEVLEIEEINPGLFTLRINAGAENYKGTLLLDIMPGNSSGEAFIVQPHRLKI